MDRNGRDGDAVSADPYGFIDKFDELQTTVETTAAQSKAAAEGVEEIKVILQQNGNGHA